MGQQKMTLRCRASWWGEPVIPAGLSSSGSPLRLQSRCGRHRAIEPGRLPFAMLTRCNGTFASGSAFQLSESVRRRRRLPIDGRRPYQAYSSLNLSNGRAGVPQKTLPAGIVLPGRMPAWPPTTTPSSSLQRSPRPAWPPNTTFLPIVQLPEMPTCAAITL